MSKELQEQYKKETGDDHEDSFDGAGCYFTYPNKDYVTWLEARLKQRELGISEAIKMNNKNIEMINEILLKLELLQTPKQ